MRDAIDITQTNGYPLLVYDTGTAETERDRLYRQLAAVTARAEQAEQAAQQRYEWQRLAENRQRDLAVAARRLACVQREARRWKDRALGLRHEQGGSIVAALDDGDEAARYRPPEG